MQRLEALEGGRLPELERRCDEALSRQPAEAAPEVVEVLAALRDALAALSAGHPAGGGGGQKLGAAGRGTLHWLLLAAAGYGGAVLSRADVAAMFLSRRILLSDVAVSLGWSWDGGG